MEFENVTLATESITLFTATGLHTFENLIDLDTLDLTAYDKHLMKALWENYLYIHCGLDNNALESFINDNGYMAPQDWVDKQLVLFK